ncbi:hypothetical protein GCM10011534_12260 [Pseudooceanicola nanhaiensis]|jgi:hypothetical protein|uniref:HK97 gp10 family phage protein n=1 Tax=Pseudooceanicola nanhaiensis TaxID=375761 RepID=A0A917SNU4_9RHOB|nr:hypothetical protein [Pseudooceanicola nanhaiensis]GGL91654.1 hypothetical protein GCM10011534_12260 [Pseudooceanicola nanhaiensis]
MGVKTSGFGPLRAKLRNLGPKADQTFEAVNRESGEEIVALAKVLVPEGETGRARSSIRGQSWEGTSYLVDFGPMARILEGDTEQRTTKDGKNRGMRKGTPFANPAIRGTYKKRMARYRKAVKGLLSDG